MHISTAFDSGCIHVLDASDPQDVRLEIPKDAHSDHRQWFHFRVTGVRDVPLRMRIVNAKDCSYPKAWEGSRAVISEDRETWTRAETRYEDGALVIEVTPASDTLSVAYFAPYSHERHLDLIDQIAQRPGVRHDILGRTLDGRDLDRLVFGTGPRVFWVIGRQHPGESMASWWMEGFLDRITDPSDALSRVVRAGATLHVVPHMNPDGGVRGHLRVNAAGTNLNRAWHEPSMEASPEVKLVRDAMDHTGVDLGLDVHGDEELPYNFISGPDGIPGFAPRLQALLDRFEAEYERANPDFQREHGYPIAAPGTANMSMFTNQVAQRYDALAMTLEMPFKDNANAPDPVFGWSPHRCRLLGASAVDPMAAVLPDLG